MKRLLLTLPALFLLSQPLLPSTPAAPRPVSCDVIASEPCSRAPKEATPSTYTWTTPSANSAGSMPVGGGGVGLNVWCDNEGTIRFYLSQSGTFDENNTMLKLGRFMLQPFPNWAEGGFSQTLHLDSGQMTLTQGGVTVTIWCDVFKPVVHIEVDAKQKILPTLSYQSWRTDDQPFTQAEGQQSSWKWLAPKQADPTRCVTRRDSIIAAPSRLTFFHQNRGETVFDYTVCDQQLDAWRDSLYNPLRNRIFGGVLTGGILTSEPQNLKTSKPHT